MQLLLFNEEFLVSASHQLALITSLPFVHTARRYYRLNGLVRRSDWLRELGNEHQSRKVRQTWSFRGSKSRNKVSPGVEVVVRSLPRQAPPVTKTEAFCWPASGLYARRQDPRD